MRIAICTLLALSVAAPGIAGQVYGSIFQKGQPLRGTNVVLICGGERVNNVTDGDGVYRLFVKTNGACTIVVEPGGRNAAAEVYSYDRPTGYNFELVDRNGRWELVRR